MASSTDRAPALAVTVALLATTLSGCGNQRDEYCSTLRADTATLARLASASGRAHTDVLARSQAVFTDLRQKAPPDVAGDWADFAGAWQHLVTAFRAAGMEPDEFDPRQRPPGVSTGQFQAIRQAAAKLDSEPVRLAAARIEDHARVVCKVDLAGGLGAGAGPGGTAG